MYPTASLSPAAFPSSAVIFGRAKDQELLERFEVDSVTSAPKINAAYKGYSGPKNHDFPVSPHLDPDNYPDVTEDFLTLKDEALGETEKIRKKWGLPGVFHLFNKQFTTGRPWDTKYDPRFPGRDRQGRTQYALYKGRVVSTNYLSNNFYGQLCAGVGIPLWFARLAAKMDACGIPDLVCRPHRVSLDLLTFRDTGEDQRAIISGYLDHQNDDPWALNGLDPSEPYPATRLADKPKAVDVAA